MWQVGIEVIAGLAVLCFLMAAWDRWLSWLKRMIERRLELHLGSWTVYEMDEMKKRVEALEYGKKK